MRFLLFLSAQRCGTLAQVLNAHIEKALWQTAGGEVNIEEIESRMEKLKKDTMQLMSQSIANNTVTEN